MKHGPSSSFSSMHPASPTTTSCRRSLREVLASSDASVSSFRKKPPVKQKQRRPFRIIFTLRFCLACSVNDSANCAFPCKELAFDAASLDSYDSRSSSITYNGGGIRMFSMREILAATSNFSPSLKIGQGASGTVYKGEFRDGRTVAIKRSKRTLYDTHLSAEFRNEVSTLSKVEHLNLVKFIGYLEEDTERILVVEYVTNGNLRQHLDGQRGGALDLATRLDIAIDVAHALTYLHLYADQSIIHRDVKSSNILLTENYRAKVADFGFSKLSPWDLEATHVSTQVKGTAGYLDPEYLSTYQLTQKSDVYSFGVLMVEIITGRKPIETKRQSKERITTRWAFQMFLDGKALQTLDPNLHKTAEANLVVEKMLELAFQCTAPSRKQRPSMKRTVELLWNIRKDFRSLLLQGDSVAI